MTDPTGDVRVDDEVSHRPGHRPQAASPCRCHATGHAIQQFRDFLAEHGEIPCILLCCIPDYGKIVDYQPDLPTIVRLYDCFAKDQPFNSTGPIGSDLMPTSPEARSVSEKIRKQAADLADREGQCFVCVWRDPYSDHARLAASKQYATVDVKGALLAFFGARLNEMLDFWPRDLPEEALSGGRCEACRSSRETGVELLASAAGSCGDLGGPARMSVPRRVC